MEEEKKMTNTLDLRSRHMALVSYTIIVIYAMFLGMIDTWEKFTYVIIPLIGAFAVDKYLSEKKKKLDKTTG